MGLVWGRISGVVATIAALSLPNVAQAGAISCTTKVAAVYVHGAGYVYADFGGAGGVGVPVLCNVSGSFVAAVVGTITPDVCKGWLSMLMTAKSTQQNIFMTIDNNNVSVPINTCANALPSWSSLYVNNVYVPPLVPSIMGLTN
jgi:hypothetical protein